jgi:hypothetical protein
MVRVINEGCDKVFNYLGFGAHKNSAKFQLFLCVVNVIFSAWPIACYVLYAKDIHVRFWLGKYPQYANLAVPVCMVRRTRRVMIWRELKFKFYTGNGIQNFDHC